MRKPTTKTLVPKLRFPEFRDTGEWAKSSLVELAKFRRGSFPQPYGLPKWYDDENGMPFVQVYDVSDNLKLKLTTKRKISKLAAEKSVFIPKKTLIVTLQGSIGRVAVTQYDAYIDRTLLIFEKFYQPTEKLFFAYIIQNLFEIEKEKAPGGIIKTITKEVLSNFIVKLPKYPEQQKIADCLSSIDELITAHSQKHEALKAHKKGLMQQLFPAQGDGCMDAGGRATQDAKAGTIPKLRFPEFQDAGGWKEKKLSKVAELTSSKRVHLSDYVSDGIPFFRGKEISLLKNQEIPKDILYISEEHYEGIRKKYGIPEVGDILITAVGTLGNVYLIQNSDKFYFKDGNLIWMKNISENSRFLETLLNVKRSDVLGSAIGSSQKALTMVELNKLEFMFPKSEEQQKIANCLSSIDDLITAQAQKIESLKAHKKGLMQQLFPCADEVNG